MLRQRLLTAAVLLAIFLPALFVETAWPFALLALVAMAIGGWEWARLNEARPLRDSARRASGRGLRPCLGRRLDGGGPRAAWWLATAAWVVGGMLVLRGGVAGWPRVPRAVRWVIGLVALWTAWLALANAKAGGLNFILSILCLVWAADVFAYFGGRAFGQHKLAPAISPGKSWEGVWSGMLGALVVAVIWLAVDASGRTDSASVYALVAHRYSYVGLACVVVFLVGMSVVGDLVESLVKRSAGAKDSSALLPGHGGVLDRVDALLPVFPIALALATSWVGR